MTPQQLKTNNINREKGVSSWLTTLPLEKYGFTLSKREFWDAIHIRYNLPLSRLPTKCICGAAFDIQHALSCKRGGFVIIRHNNLRDLIAEQLQEVCHDVKIEPQLEQITGEVINGNISAEARSDISARGFWVKGQIAFFDIRVFDPNARRYATRNLTQCYKSNETEKKKQYNQRIIEVDQGSFCPLIFSVNGGTSNECSIFLKRLMCLMSKKRNEHISTITSFMRTKINFALLRSLLLCIRGSRSLNDRNAEPLSSIMVDCALQEAKIVE